LVTIAELSFEPLDLELHEPFGIALGAQERVANVLVRLELDDGTIGLGEAAPFPAVSGETQRMALDAVERVRPSLVGRSAQPWRELAAELAAELGDVPSALCAIECALIDALCRRERRSLLDFFGAAEARLVTDITIPTGTPEHAERATLRALAAGFRTLKIKVGGVPLEHDRQRLLRACKSGGGFSLILDGNASLSAEQALELLSSLGAERSRVRVFEQPTPAADLEGLRRVREQGKVLVAADESARSTRDVEELAAERAVDLVNLKIMKSGVGVALDMLACARRNGLGLMIGGMVETRLAMTVSACIAAGAGGFAEVDLDTPLFINDTRLSGGFTQRGPTLDLSQIRLGHGVEQVGAGAPTNTSSKLGPGPQQTL
jgi:L-alanine-DL-glutamate epimerase-like enolase superfamily enzyme